MNNSIQPRVPWVFFLLTFSLSWVFWLPAAFLDSWSEPLQSVLWLLGGFGPSVAGVIRVMRTAEPEERRAFWRRVFGLRRVEPIWYAIVLLLFPLIYALAIGINWLLGGTLPGFALVNQVAENPLALVGALVLGIFLGPLSEELGWRGYALDPLQVKWGALGGSLFLAPIWWLWHLPLFAIEMTAQYEWGIWSLQSLMFFLGVFSLSILFTWFYNSTGRSVLAVILGHFSYNFFLNVIYPVPDGMFVVQGVLLIVAAAVVTLVCGPSKLVCGDVTE